MAEKISLTFARLWQRLTEPHPSIQTMERRRRARLLSAMLVGLSALILFAVVVASWLIYRSPNPFGQPLTALGVLSLIVFLFDYRLSRTRHAALAAYVLVYGNLLATLVSIAVAPGEEALFVFLALTLQMGSLLFARGGYVLLFSVTLLGTLSLSFIIPQWAADGAVPAAVVVLMFGAFNLLSTHTRERHAREIETLALESEARLRHSEERAAELSEALIALAILDFDKPAATRGTDDVFDALAIGVNMLGEELQARVSELTATNERLSHLLETLPIVVYTARAEAEADYATTHVGERVREVAGYEPQEFLSKPSFWAERIHPEDAPRVFSAISQIPQTGLCHVEYRWRVADGSYNWFADSMRLAAHDHIVGVWQDVTARKQAEEELRRARDAAEAASRAKSEFLSIVSHELRSPLNAILGFAQLLELEAASLPERSARGARQIGESGRRLLAMIDEILDFARSETGRLKLDLQPVDASASVREVCAKLADSAAEKRLTLTLDLPPHPCRVHADPRRLDQILRTLIRNAIQFTPEGGEVRVQLSAISDQSSLVTDDRSLVTDDRSLITDDRSLVTGNRLLIAITDTGIGIHPEQLPQLFEPFSQADASASRAHSGLGLELAFARRLAHMHDGNLRAESEGHGKGTSFFLELPLERPRTSEVSETSEA